MAHEYYFAVNTDDDKGVPFGPVNKDNMDVSRLIVDMNCWLDPSESITHIEHMLITANPLNAPTATWRSDYPSNGYYPTSGSGTDVYPLGFARTAVIDEGRMIAVDLASGTPGLTYGVSFTATAGVSRRRRVIDILVAIDQPLNSGMIALAETPPSYFYPLVITTNTLLPYGFAGRVYIQNGVSGPLSVVLPPSPVLGQTVSVADIGRNANIWPVTFYGDSSSPNLDTSTSTSYVASYAGFDLEFEWSGVYWHINNVDGDLPLTGGTLSGSLYVLGHVDTDQYDLRNRVFADMDVAATRIAIHDPGDQLTNIHMYADGKNYYDNNFHNFRSRYATATFVIFNTTGTYNQSGSWNVISDDSLKQNVVPYTTGLAAVLALNPVSFEYTQATSLRTTGETNYGLMASEVQPVIPEMVREVDLNLDGTTDPIQTLSPTHLVYVLLNAVKELEARVRQLETPVGE